MNFMEICRIIDFCNSQELEECLSIKEALKDQELQEWRKEHPYRYIFNNILVGGIFAAAACVFLHPLFMR
ncbi:MAG: hypothetical protein LBB05_04300 [Puniceicoccales bacterium]|nr:hypothetical protein [Puniceicoccales bacterium]